MLIMGHEPPLTIQKIHHELFRGDAFNHYPSDSINEIIPSKLFIGTVYTQ